jgi:Ca2+-binding RTX toxin-like protein
MKGSWGDDTYVVDNVGDVVVEYSGEGVDLVNSSVSYTLGEFAENLTLLTNANLTGSGNLNNNSITGNSGANRINGGYGNDTLSGGAGNDTFVFSWTLDSNYNRDIITDFSVADDTVELSKYLFTSLAPGNLSTANFVSGANASPKDSDDYVIYDTNTGSLYYDANGNGSGGSVKFVTLTGIPGLTVADFVVV